ncbi:MAG: multidrug ABC transporter ATP-binding protein [Bacteroidetes bacterium GWF2_33_16]|nr:MAG: multidrug ABC transporter ATP-binding protein [Bacteroidetes bacterium GWE2_32_14]OFY06367.1 MAG: multidrug ABC transporter ATP-binding protein [Bacteroidetes bacterium GWF2_33_16]
MELKITDLSKTYPNGVQALKNVNLTIPKGMFGLLGPNGAGKSTLMRTIATLQEADNGEIQLDGLNVLKEKAEVRKQLGYLPQEFGVYPKISAEAMLDHFAELKGITNKNERRELVKSLLEQTNLYHVRKKNLSGYSGGMKQRFGIAQALLGNPKLIIVDEPTAGLDPAERNRFHNLLSEIGENIIVILSTHIVDDVSDLCKSMAIINEGEVLLYGQPLELIKNIEGKIWEKVIDKDELKSCQDNYNIISTRLYLGKIIVHAYSESNPDSFEMVKPNLEDVYFSAIKNAKTVVKSN